MKTLTVSAVFIVTLLLGSCNRNADITNSSSDYSMDTIVCATTSDTPLDSIIAKIEYIKLKSTEEHPVGEIDNLLITPEHIIVADRHLAKSIFIFDRQGMIQTVICRHGRGPAQLRHRHRAHQHPRQSPPLLALAYAPHTGKPDATTRLQ